MRREVPLWLAIVVIVLIILIAVGVFLWRSRAAAPSGEPPALTSGEAETGY